MTNLSRQPFYENKKKKDYFLAFDVKRFIMGHYIFVYLFTHNNQVQPQIEFHLKK